MWMSKSSLLEIYATAEPGEMCVNVNVNNYGSTGSKNIFEIN